MAATAANLLKTSARAARLALLPVALCSALFVAAGTPAWALSEIKQQDAPPAAADSPSDDSIRKEPLPPVEGVPQPDPIQTTPPTTTEEPATVDPEDEATPEESAPDDSDGAATVGRPVIDPDAPPPPIMYDVDKLPEPVKRMRQLIIDATRTGDVEKLRPLIGAGNSATQLSLGGIEGDPVDFLKSLSGDPDGVEILAILQEVITAGYVHLDAGKPEELYVWPYFIAIPLDDLTAAQKVELFKIVTAGDYEDMKSFGAYIFYRVGITPDGHWQFFVAGD
jgi:hypothetical protein